MGETHGKGWHSPRNFRASISPDERELFFTRVGAITADARPTIYRAARASIDEPFGVPQHGDAADGFVEGATLAPDGALTTTAATPGSARSSGSRGRFAVAGVRTPLQPPGRFRWAFGARGGR